MKRFFKTLALLIIGMLLLVSGFDSALDRLAAAPTQSSFTQFTPRGAVLLTYEGNLAFCTPFTHPFRTMPRAFQPRPGFAPRA